MRSALVAALAASIAIAPTASIAANGDASALSLQGAVTEMRAGGELNDANSLGLSTIAIVAIGVAAVILLFVILDDDDDSDSP